MKALIFAAQFILIMIAACALLWVGYVLGYDSGRAARGHWVKATQTIEYWEFKGEK